MKNNSNIYYVYCNWNKYGILLLLLFLAGLFVFNAQYGERIQFNDGLGWDGSAYADWAQRDPVEILSSKKVPDYYIGRLLPPFVVHYFSALVNFNIDTTVNVIKAFYVFDTISVIFSFIFLWLIARNIGWNGPVLLSASACLLFNYAVLKNMSYNPTLTDMFALTVGSALLYCWQRKILYCFIITAFIGSFVWPSYIYISIPIILLWNLEESDHHRENSRFVDGSWIALGIAVTIASASLYFYFGKGFRLPVGTSQVDERWLWLSVPVLMAFVFFALRSFISPSYYIAFTKKLSLRHITYAVILYAVVKGVVWLFSSGEPGPLVPSTYIALIAQGGLVTPAKNLVAHMSHYGTVIALALLLWPRIQSSVLRAGPGVAVVFAVCGFLAIGTESRQFIPFLPFLVFFISEELSRLKIDWFGAWYIALTSLVMSRFWMTINVGPWTGKFLEFPDQMLYMYSGPWMSNTMYLVFLNICVLLLLGTWMMLRNYKPKSVVLDSG